MAFHLPSRLQGAQSNRWGLKRSQQLQGVGHACMALWAVLAGTAIATQLPWIQRIEGQAQAFLLTLRGPVTPPTEVVILAIDDESLAQGEFFQNHSAQYPYLEPLATWPWRRQAYATAIERLMAAGARTVAIDILFVDPSSYGPADDAALQATLSRHGQQVVLAAAYESSSATGGQLTQLLQPLYPQIPHVGLINFPLDPDFKIRQLPEAYLQEVKAASGSEISLPSLAGATLAAAQLPVQEQGNQLFFYGPAGTFPQIPFWHVLDPQNWTLLKRAGVFKDKIVLIGPTATSLQDIKRTPVSDLMSGVEIHATAVATLLEGRGLAEAVPNSQGRGLLLALVLGAVGLLLGHQLRRPLPRVVGFAGSAIAWGAIGYLSLVYGSRLVPVAIPVAALGVAGLTYTAVGAVGDRLEERRLRGTLERYVAPPVVEEILRQPQDFSIFVGRRLQAAVMFSDIRGFSRLTYQMGAEDMVQLLNTYLDAMVNAILAYRGTVDKFIGDAVMAEFGSPVSQGEQEDALNAVCAALAMRQALANLRQTLRQNGQPPLFHGIGLSYGELVVGNIGSIKRLEYTVIGDVVNVASRIEGLTKQLGTDILITESLYQRVKDQITVVDYGQHRLAGREQETVQVYGLVSLKEGDPALYHQVQADLQSHLRTSLEGQIP
ncbi:MAG TPA: adenylate/guanylate cyclase domain-containing protein [Trichocoleus sp.]